MGSGVKLATTLSSSGATPTHVFSGSEVRHLVVSDSLWPHGPQSTRLLCPWNSPDKNTGVGSISFSRGSSRPRDQAQVSGIVGRCFTDWAIREATHFSKKLQITTTHLIHPSSLLWATTWQPIRKSQNKHNMVTVLKTLHSYQLDTLSENSDMSNGVLWQVP